MATTTNYGWTTPDDTGLVKDGASAIRSLGTAIDTTTKNLNPQTTTGAIAYRSSTSNVNTSLPIGTAGQILTVNSGATAPEWQTLNAGGMTLLSTTTLSGATTTISSISTSYIRLFMVMYGVTAAGNGLMRIALNSNTTGASYVNVSCDGTTTTTNAQNSNYIRCGATGWDGTNANNITTLLVDNYASSSNYKSFICYGYARNSSGADSAWTVSGGFISNTAVTSIQLSQVGGNLSAGTVLVYGVK